VVIPALATLRTSSGQPSTEHSQKVETFLISFDVTITGFGSKLFLKQLNVQRQKCPRLKRPAPAADDRGQQDRKLSRPTATAGDAIEALNGFARCVLQYVQVLVSAAIGAALRGWAIRSFVTATGICAHQKALERSAPRLTQTASEPRAKGDQRSGLAKSVSPVSWLTMRVVMVVNRNQKRICPRCGR